MSDNHLLTIPTVYEIIWSLGQVTQSGESPSIFTQLETKMANAKYNTQEQAIIDAADEALGKYGEVKKLCAAFTGDRKEFLKKIRTFGEKVVSVRDLRKGNEAQKIAATRYDTISTTFRRIDEEKKTPAEKATAEKAAEKAKKKRAADAKAKVIESVASSPKAVIKLAEVQVAALQQKEKAPFDIPRAIAAWQSLAAVYAK